MNTAQAMTAEYRPLIQEHLLRLMFDDGFFVCEALDHTADYCRCIFNGYSRTGEAIVRKELLRLERQAMEN